jgi:hypothetical protein
MSADWTSEVEGWDKFVEAVRVDALQKIDSSALVMSLVPSRDVDVKFAVELGIAIMRDKPLLVVAMPGRTVPERLARVADKVVYADPDLEEGRTQIGEAVKQMMGDT